MEEAIWYENSENSRIKLQNQFNYHIQNYYQNKNYQIQKQPSNNSQNINQNLSKIKWYFQKILQSRNSSQNENNFKNYANTYNNNQVQMQLVSFEPPQTFFQYWKSKFMSHPMYGLMTIVGAYFIYSYYINPQVKNENNDERHYCEINVEYDNSCENVFKMINSNINEFNTKNGKIQKYNIIKSSDTGTPQNYKILTEKEIPDYEDKYEVNFMFSPIDKNPNRCAMKSQSMVKQYKQEFGHSNYCNLFYLINGTNFVAGKVIGGFNGKPDKQDYDKIEHFCKSQLNIPDKKD